MKTQIIVETPTTLENQPHWWTSPPFEKSLDPPPLNIVVETQTCTYKIWTKTKIQ
jgi:hypothetical protein